LLVELGADVSAAKVNCLTPVSVAALKGHDSTIRLLAELGADANAHTHGCTAVHIAAQQGHKSTVQFLKELGADT